MLSVTQRIKTITQPRGGYVPAGLFKEERYEDLFALKEIQSENVSLFSIQGSAVDYLTRYMLTGDIVSAFHIPFLGASVIDEANENNKEKEHLSSLLAVIHGLDDYSVEAACRAVGYDVAFRMGMKAFKSVDDIPLTPEMYFNIRIMVGRCISFLKRVGPIVSSEMTFEGGYTELVSKGDADFLTKDMIIDLKASQQEMQSTWSLQLLMYYLLGLHSIHPEYQTVHKLCVFNPYKNESYIASISDIPDEVKYKVSHEVIGYKMAKSYLDFSDPSDVQINYSSWNLVEGSDERVLQKFFTERVSRLAFHLEDYKDGIHKISVNEYWACLGQVDKEYAGVLRPSFSRTAYVLMLKKVGYLLFLSVSHKGTLGILNGGTYRNCAYTPEYYYENMERYASAIIARFSGYWDALHNISRQIKKLKPSEKALKALYSDYRHRCKGMMIHPYTYNDWYKEYRHTFMCTGRVHGCIVDIDYLNHVYVNPYDGAIIPYYAISMYDKDVYRSVRSLVSHRRPELMDAFTELANKHPQSLLVIGSGSEVGNLLSENKDTDNDIVKVYSHDMYAISNRLKPLQKIYDVKIIQVWYDSILWNGRLLENISKPEHTKTRTVNYEGQSIQQKNGRIATIIRYGSYRDVDIQFDDDTVIEKVSVQRWKNGTIKHPDDQRIKTERAPKEKISIRDKYVGRTKKMRCGLSATIIDYQGYNKVTVRFEDGLIRKNVRSDHFNDGNIAHSSDSRD